MNEVIAWVTFAGAWLPGRCIRVRLSVTNSMSTVRKIEGIKASAVRATQGRPSAWWWLVPPVMYMLHYRWTEAFRQATFAQLTQTRREQLTSLRNKATGWFTVAAGALLLAAGET
jgi:hypothetical protein